MNDSTSPTSPAWPTRWPKDSFTGIWTWLLSGVIAALLIALFFVALKLGRTPIQPPNPLVFDLSILLQFVLEGVLVAIVLAAMPVISKFSLRELGFRMPNARTVGTAVVGAAAMAIVANGSASLIDYLAKSQHQQDIVEIFKTLHNPTTIVIFAVFAVVFAPFAEETIFRILYFNLGMRYGGFWGGAVLSGALFGLAHGDVYAALPLALGGVVLCAVYYRTANAYASMISHALFNALSIAALLFAPQLTR